MSYFRRPNPKSNWKRPKPRIYDCNNRDLEKFYQNSYNEYLSVKNELRAKDMNSRGDPEELTRRFEQRRASSLVYGEDDTPRQHRFIPPNRQLSNEGTNEHTVSFTRSRTERTESGASELPRDIRSTTSASRSLNYTNSLNSNDSETEMAGIEQRLERLRKLREELGLPAENTATKSSSSAATSNYASNSYESSSDTRGKDRWSTQGSAQTESRYSRSSPSRSATESSYASKTKSSLRNGLGGDDESTYTSRSSKLKSSTDYGLGDDDTKSSYTVKSTRFKLPSDSNDYESSSSSKYESSATKSRQKVERPTLDGIDTSFDDEIVDSVRRKFPSSSEILDRIKNMDID